MKITLDTKYIHNEPAIVKRGKYHNGETALVLEDSLTGERLSNATINLEEYDEHPAEGNVFIKDYSENEGILECLIDQGVISEPVRTVHARYIDAYECKLLVTPEDLA